MAIKEAMCLDRPAYALGRLSRDRERDRWLLNPAGRYVVVSQYATHRHPQFWDDPDAYDPARFTSGRERERHPHAYFPFGAGPRACIGSHFAMLEATIAVAVLLRRVRVHSHQEDVPLATTRGSRCGPRAPFSSS